MPFLNVFRDQPIDCGLIYYFDQLSLGQRYPVPVPLKKADLNVTVVNFVASVELRQEYVNREANPIEASYLFPVEEECAVVDFEAIVDGRTITTKVKAKDEARREYREAVEKKHTTILLEEAKPDVFQIKVLLTNTFELKNNDFCC